MDKKPFYATFIEKPQKIKKSVPKKQKKELHKKIENEEKSFPNTHKSNDNIKKTIYEHSKIKIESSLFNKLTKQEYELIDSFFQFVDPVLHLNQRQKTATFKKTISYANR